MPLVLVTGSTDGIGRQTALDLSRQGADVIVHGRSAEKVEAVRGALSGRSYGITGDLASLASVRALGAELVERFPKLDVLLHNAGVFATERKLTSDGHELTNAVNHLAPVLLTHLALPALRAAAAPRIVLVSSVAHVRGRIDPDDLDLAGRFDGYQAYSQSKLANVLTAVELARRLPGFAVNALHPGVVSTKLLRAGFGMQGPDSLADGARTSVLLALDPRLGKVTGQYFQAGKPAAASPLARDAALCRRLYEKTCAIVGVDPLPG